MSATTILHLEISPVVSVDSGSFPMATEPFLSSPPKTHFQNLLPDEEIGFPITQSMKDRLIFGEIEDLFPESPPESPLASFTSRQKSNLHRSRTAPAMAVMRDLKPQDQKPQFESNSIIKQAAALLLIYLSLGVAIYSFTPQHFSGVETHPVVDALYFCIVTMCTIGYGDIAPLTPATKAFACVFVLFGFGFIDVLLSGVVNYVLDLQENMILASIRGHHHAFAKNYIFDVDKGRMRIRMKVALALGVVISCIGMGSLVLFFVEDLDWVDSVYLSVMSVTTVGYGDRAFRTLPGRLFASLWLLFSTLAVARAFLYLAEWRIDKRHRRITKWVLDRDLTVEDLLAADVNNNGFIRTSLENHYFYMERNLESRVIMNINSVTEEFLLNINIVTLNPLRALLFVILLSYVGNFKSEYVIFKLKEMGKISEKDILQICAQFSKLDPNNSGKITLPELLESRR
ncbi:hypothetical protein ACLOJK_022069 [Asimina triloba]